MKKTLLSFGKALEQLAAAGTALIAAVEASEPAVEASESAPEAAPTPSEPAPEPPSEAASDPHQRSAVSMTRSAFAQLVFPKMSRHQAGLAVAGVIVSNQHLLARLKKVGYRPNQVGYTLPQLEILCEYFKIHLS